MLQVKHLQTGSLSTPALSVMPPSPTITPASPHLPELSGPSGLGAREWGGGPGLGDTMLT